MRVYADLEIRILELQNESYPVEMTLNGKHEFPRGYLGSEDLLRVFSASTTEDGERLFAWLFADDALKMAWAEARGRCPQRRIRLRIDADAPELHAIPWELLRDAKTRTPPQDLAADVATPFSRYLAGRQQPGSPIMGRPIKILVAIANPQNLADDNLAPLDIKAEWAVIREATAGLDVELVPLPQPCTLSTLEVELKKGYHILHFVGHGNYNERKGTAFLYLADQENQSELIRDADFAAMLDRQLIDTEVQPDDKLRLVFLASCQTATRSPADAFRGFAPALVAVGVPAVLAMQDSVPIRTASEFTRTFYRQLLLHGQVDLASNEARSALLTGDFSGSSIPVLFSRLPDNQLLAPLTGDAAPVIEIEYFEPETIYIPPGSFLMGSQEGEGVPAYETPQHKVDDLPAYRIGKYPVTNEQYAEFIRQTGRIVAPEAGWEGQTPPTDRLNHPVAGVTWYDALAYCEWLSEQTGRKYSLPSEAQWEKAARGTDGWIYPWGDEWDPSRCNHRSGQIVQVDACPPQSVYGCYDMIGNVREWTRSLWGEGLRRPNPDFCYPWANDRREDVTASHYVLRVYRGGGVGDRVERLRCSARNAYWPDKPGPPRKRHGFRVVWSEV